MSVRISATDWVEGRRDDGADAVEIARAFTAAGADIIHVSTGQTSPDAKPVYGRMWQTPFSDRIRNELGIRTIAVGNDHRARPGELDHRRRPRRPLRPRPPAPGRPALDAARRGAARLREQRWPWQYRSGKEQLERLLERGR